MKTNTIKLILMTVLCVVLCVAAMPFSVSAEDTAEKDALKQIADMVNSFLTTTTTAAGSSDSGSSGSGSSDSGSSGSSSSGSSSSGSSSSGSSSSESASVTVGSASGKTGDTVTVDVDLTQNPGVIAMALDVNYDEKQLELVNVQNSGVLNNYNSSSDYSGGKYTLNWNDALSTTNNNGTGKIATLTFKIKEDCDKASITVSGKGHGNDDASGIKTVNVSGGSGTITNTTPTTTTTTTKPTTTKAATTKASTEKGTTAKSTTAASGATRAATNAYTRSYNEGNTYPIDFEIPTTEEEESTTDLLDLWESTTEFLWTEPSTMETMTEAIEVKESTPLSKTKLILIVLMACFAIVGIAIIVSMVRKSKG